jgi:hypothetical protein
VSHTSFDDDDDTADDDVGTSLDVGMPAAEIFRVVLAETLLCPEATLFPPLLARSHVHATRAPPRCLLP